MVAETEHWQPPEAGRNKEGPPPHPSLQRECHLPTWDPAWDGGVSQMVQPAQSVPRIRKCGGGALRSAGPPRQGPRLPEGSKGRTDPGLPFRHLSAGNETHQTVSLRRAAPTLNAQEAHQCSGMLSTAGVTTRTMFLFVHTKRHVSVDSGKSLGQHRVKKKKPTQRLF